MVVIAVCCVCNSCVKEKRSDLNYDLAISELRYSPEQTAEMNLTLIPGGRYDPFSLVWNEPSTFVGEGPFPVEISRSMILDFEIHDSEGFSQRFSHEIRTDTIDSLRFDYRNAYIGDYSCQYTYTYEEELDYGIDTLRVIKNEAFDQMNILTGNDRLRGYEGNKMTYLWEDAFYGYHSSVIFSGDSIYFMESGPLGQYNTMYYRGTKIE